jgi:Ca-activated chloride channel homolog
MRMLRVLLCALCVLIAPLLAADGAVTVTLEPLGDTDAGVAARVSFRFARPAEVTADSALVLQGSFMQNGRILRNFRYVVPPEKDGETKTVQVFAEGEAVVETRLLVDDTAESSPLLLGKSTETFKIEKTNKVYVADLDDGAEAVLAEGVLPEAMGAVKIRSPRRDVAPNLFIVNVDVLPPVKRVEFWVEGKKVIARNAPPYTAELDLGKLPKRVEVKAIGFDAQGRYVDADAFIVNERETPLEVKITRTETPDGLAHFKLSVMNPKNTNIKSVVLFAGDKKLHEWRRPPYAIDLPAARLAGYEFVRASVVDSTGYEASDLLFLSGDRYIEEIEVNIVELPVQVTDAGGVPVPNLTDKNFTILENGQPKQVAALNYAANLPLSVGVLLDHSRSMEKRIGEAKQAASEFFRSIIKYNDRGFITGFSAEPGRGAPFVGDPGALEVQVGAIPDVGGSTALYDAIVTGLYRFRNVQGRKALIVITDGDDTSSRLSYDDMLVYARSARVPLYFIGIGFGLGNFGGPSTMRNLAAETGGVVYLIRNVSQLGETYKQLEADLRSQYLLTYRTESTKKDTAYRTIEVKVDRPDAKVRTIRGFIP